VRIDSCAEPVFARHESFHPRHGWMKKAIDGATADPRIFTQERAIVDLGVGKNMVRSIRHWGLAAKVLAQADDPEQPRVPLSVPSRIGRVLLGDGGWDPYCEAPGTLWVLHWLLVAPPSKSPVWWVALNEFPAVEFGEEELLNFVTDFLAGVAEWETPHPSSVKKDVDCFLRMYSTKEGPRKTLGDDLIDCPFRELGLLRAGSGSHRAYRLIIGPKPSLPPEVALYAALDFMARTDASSRTATVSRLATEPGSPGRAFKLTETDLTDLLRRSVEGSSGVRLTSSAGVPQLVYEDEAPVAAADALWRYYRRLDPEAVQASEPIAGQGADLPAGADFLIEETFLARKAKQRRKSIVDPHGPAPKDRLRRLEWAQARVDAGVPGPEDA
jgi:hypothetical protein